MIGVGQGAVPVLARGQELAVSVHDGGQHGQRLTGRSGWGGRDGDACSFRMYLVVAVQLGRRGGPGAGSARWADTVNTYARLMLVPRVRAT